MEIMKLIQSDGSVSDEDADRIELGQEFYEDIFRLSHLASQPVSLLEMIDFNAKETDKGLPPELCGNPILVARAGLGSIMVKLLMGDKDEDTDRIKNRRAQFLKWCRNNLSRVTNYGRYILPDVGVGKGDSFLLRKVEDAIINNSISKQPKRVCFSSPEIEAAESFMENAPHTIDEVLVNSARANERVLFNSPRYRVVRFERDSDTILFRMLHCP